MGGVNAILKGLKVDAEIGLVSSGKGQEDIPLSVRESAFGPNVLPAVKPKSLFFFILRAFEDKILILLTVAAFVALGVGLYVDFKETPADKAKTHWIEGFAIIVAVIIVVLAGSINDFNKEKAFQKLNAKKEDRKVKALRDGKTQLVSIYAVLVGDILLLEPGDIIGADGVYISGMGLRCDESAATGETDAIKKGEDSDPFLLSGSKVQEGIGKYIVTGVGVHSFHGKTMMALRTEDEDTPLQVKLDGLAERIAKLGSAAAIIMFVVLFLKYIIVVLRGSGFGNDREEQESGSEIVSQIIKIVIGAITVIVVAVPEGLPLAVTLALAFATTRMIKDNNLVRVLSACETMGNATTICSDKTGTLTQNKMTVVTGVIGKNVLFQDVDEIAGLEQKLASLASSGDGSNGRVAINSSAFEGVDEVTGEASLIGSKTETALLEWCTGAGKDWKQIRTATPGLSVVQIYPFSSERKRMSTIVKIEREGQAPIYRIHVKGASEIVLQDCDRAVLLPFSSSPNAIAASDKNPHASGRKPISFRAVLNGSVRENYLASKKAERELARKESDAHEGVLYDPAFTCKGLVCAAIVGIEDPLRAGVPEAVEACKGAGVFVRMVTGDNVLTARSIAERCGIHTKGGLVMEGTVFRRMSEEERKAILPRLQVLARSSPTDKQLLVQGLKELGETVAVTGDGTNDGPALKLADIGFSMGIAGTEVAKEASSIILMDDSFSSVVSAIMWGRSVNDSVRKFLQFQLSVNISAVAITFISAVLDSGESSVLTAVQLLWVNLIMDSLAALALATERPTPELLNRPPTSKKAKLISITMWKMIFGQSVLQIAVNLTLLKVNNPQAKLEKELVRTIVFNTFVMMQIFNMVNCRRIDNKLNVFKRLFTNAYFYLIFLGVAVTQFIVVQYGTVVFNTTILNVQYWAVCVIIGAISIPWGAVVRLIPDELFESCFGRLFLDEPTPSQVALQEIYFDGAAPTGGAAGIAIPIKESKDGKLRHRMKRIRENFFSKVRGSSRRENADA
ncbi:hypothetical protein BC829DRAFT_359858 [Chytridium lagenaria]|nr:hypothetical protein BC829DRAFT_359858 [Chytridium lagenaria]